MGAVLKEVMGRRKRGGTRNCSWYAMNKKRFKRPILSIDIEIMAYLVVKKRRVVNTTQKYQYFLIHPKLFVQFIPMPPLFQEYKDNT